MKVGDLVKVKNYSSPKNKESDRLAIVVWCQLQRQDYCEIAFTDTGDRKYANISNLELLNEYR